MLIMFYPDLKPYQIYGKYYMDNINIGWLSTDVKFEKGEVAKNLLDKLLYLTSLVNEQDEWSMTHPSGIVVHRMFVSRGLPYACPFCDEEIKLLVDSKEIVLGYQGKIKLNKIKFTNCQKDKKLIKYF